MAEPFFTLEAEISTDDAQTLGAVLAARFPPDEIARVPGGLRVSCVLQGPSARELNRELLSYLRRAVKKTRLRARWQAGGVTERYFDCVFKGRDG